MSKLGIDDYFNLDVSSEEIDVFLKWSKKYAQKIKFKTISNPEGKVYMAILVRFIRDMERSVGEFMEERRKSYRFMLKVEEVVTVHRLCKLIQMEIGEENEEQQIIQRIQQDLYKVI